MYPCDYREQSNKCTRCDSILEGNDYETDDHQFLCKNCQLLMSRTKITVHGIEYFLYTMNISLDKEAVSVLFLTEKAARNEDVNRALRALIK